jgi:hypothetical protein
MQRSKPFFVNVYCGDPEQRITWHGQPYFSPNMSF